MNMLFMNSEMYRYIQEGFEKWQTRTKPELLFSSGIAEIKVSFPVWKYDVFLWMRDAPTHHGFFFFWNIAHQIVCLV